MKKRPESTVARPIAPEDIRSGMYVAVLHEVGEHMPPCYWSEGFDRRSLDPVRIRWLPDEDAAPMRVVDVCLPFVLARNRDGSIRTLDVRRHQLAQLSRSYGQAALSQKRASRDREKGSREER